MVSDEPHALEQRIAQIDWSVVADDLEHLGHALTPTLLGSDQCEQIAAWYDRPALFRRTVDLARHRFGEGGAYRYFADPLPELIAALRASLYSPLAPLANLWSDRLGSTERFPATHEEYRQRCHRHGQPHPTPLLLHYEAGGYNCLHQDRYGALAFPLQLTGMLSAEGAFTGGEFLLVEQRPRMQTRGEAIHLAQGRFVIFPNQQRPVRGTRGDYRVNVRHGVSRVRSGTRRTLGIIFHDAEK